jgi:myo-inositol 2-dehydrogenase/D-chiro-inositol 1-dehydrogenase
MALQVGIVGTGWFSKVHADLLAQMEGVRVQAITGTSQDKADRMAAVYGAKGYERITDMLDAERLDAIYICVPPMSHGEIERELIDRGIPFLVEKPLGLDTELPGGILKSVQDKGLITSVGYHFRYRTSVTRLKELLCTCQIGMALGYWMGDMPLVPWWRNQATSGGQFIEQTTHMVDLLRYTAGEVEEVYAVYGNQIMHKVHDHVTVPDVGTVSMKMRSGAVVNVSNTCVLPGGISKVGLTFYTNEGMLDWNTERLDVVGKGGKVTVTDETQHYLLENEAFIHAVRTGDTSLIRSDYADAFKTQVVTTAAQRSAETGLPVRLSLEA